MRLGLITRNFPPAVGGMAEHAAGLANTLSNLAEIQLILPKNMVCDSTKFSVHAVLTNSLEKNLPILEDIKVDAWLGLSAYFVPMAPALSSPFFAYFHGNDFLTPNYSPADTVLAKLHKIPFLWRFNGLYWLFAKGMTAKRRRRKIRRALGNVRAIYTNSTNTKNIIRRYYNYPEKKIIVNYPGCTDEFFWTGKQISSPTLRLLTVSNLASRRKNVDGVLKAISIIGDSIPLYYTIIGGGDHMPRLKRMANKLGISDWVEFAGRVSRSDLLRAYRENDVMVLASKASSLDVEGFGMVYIEANAAGTPVICSRQGGAVDAVVDGVTGIILPDSTPKQIAYGIRRFYNERNSFHADCIREHADRFRWHRTAADLFGSLQSILTREDDRT